MKILKRLFKLFFVLFLFIVICIIAVNIYALFMPKISIKNANTYYIYDKDGNLVNLGSSSNKWVSIDDVSNYYIDAVLSIEDKNFYKHNGFDYLRIIKALIKNVQNKSIVEGASTISQQYIKNLYQNFDRTFNRKFKETIQTINLEMNYSKKEILEGYINTINFGQGNIGISNASHYYFNKEPKDLTLEEAAILAAIPKNPSNYNPISNYNNSINRAKMVIKYMIKNKKISKNEAKDLFKNDIQIYGKNDKENLNMLMYYQDAVINELKNKVNIPDNIIRKKGIKIYTNLDLDVQKNLENNIYKYMSDESMQIASIIIDPKTGGIIALTGGLDYSKSTYNRAISAKRQVGSTMKSFLYYAALENGLTSSSTFSSEPTTFTTDDNKTYSPINYGNKYANKKITMAQALAVSDNIYAVKTNLFLGGNKLIETANKCGIKTKLNNIPSLPLGTIEIPMIDYAQGYQTLANEGTKIDIHLINKVEDSEGNTLYKFDEEKENVLNFNYVYILNEMLSNTSNKNFIDYTNPTALIIKNKLKENYAIKTGTTATDFWTIGYNKNKLMLVWAGNDDSSEVSSSKSFYTKNIFADTIESYNNSEDSWYSTPENVTGVILEASTGNKPSNNSINNIYYFMKGTELIN